MKTRFDKDADEFLRQLRKSVKKLKRKTADKAVDSICKKAPVLTGNYLKSTKVGIDTIDRRHEPVIDNIIISLSIGRLLTPAAKAAMRKKVNLELKTKILAARFENTINISNSIPYADMVEYIGWEKTPPYQVFGLTAELVATWLAARSKNF